MIRRRLGFSVGLLLVVGVVAAGGGTIYVWRDSAGVSHYTTDPEAVPVEYREAAIPIVPDEATAVDFVEVAPEEPVSTSPSADREDEPAPAAGLQPDRVDRDGESLRTPSPSERQRRSLLERQRRARRSAWEGD